MVMVRHMGTVYSLHRTYLSKVHSVNRTNRLVQFGLVWKEQPYFAEARFAFDSY